MQKAHAARSRRSDEWAIDSRLRRARQAGDDSQLIVRSRREAATARRLERRQRILASIEERAMAARVEQDRQLQFAKLEQTTMKLAQRSDAEPHCATAV